MRKHAMPLNSDVAGCQQHGRTADVVVQNGKASGARRAACGTRKMDPLDLQVKP